MKVVMAASHYPPRYIAGVELITQRMARWLVAQGHAVEVVCVEHIDAATHLFVQTDDRDGVTIHRLGLRLAGTGEHLGLRYQDDLLGEWFAEYLARSRPDLLHSQSCYLLTASTVEAAKRCGVPVVVELHDYWFFCPRISLLRSNGQRCIEPATAADCAWCLMAERRRYRFLESAAQTIGRPRIQGSSEAGPLGWPLDGELRTRVAERQAYLDAALRSADRIVTTAPLARDLLLARGYSPAKVRVIPSGLETDRRPHRPRATPSGGLRIGYLGQLAPHKGVHLLVQAFQHLCASGSPLELHVFGDPTRAPGYAAELKRLAGHSPRICFRGPYDNGRVGDILAELAVAVVPSVWFEVHPLVILESFAAGVPVVASRLPNMQYQIQHERNGLLFAPGDVEDLARTLQRLIDEPGLLDRLRQGIAPVRTIDEEMAEIESIYRAVTGGVWSRVEETDTNTIASLS